MHTTHINSAKRRQEEKLLKQKLDAEKALQKQRLTMQIKQSKEEKEKQRIKDIRAKGLDKLDMSYRELLEIPLELYKGAAAQDKLDCLVWADFSNNKITELPATAFLFWFTAIRRLSFAHNRMLRLPSEFENMAKLEVLDLSNNELINIPAEIDHCTALRHLDVNHNNLEVLPSEIGKLTNLEYLCVHSNKLYTLPEEFGNLSSLERLDLRGNGE